MFYINELNQTRFYIDAKKEGREEGYEEGLKEGREEGRRELLCVAVPLLLRSGMTVEQVAEQLKVDVETVRQVAER
jgi:predicted transposase/invertase (TIGR01784 family)